MPSTTFLDPLLRRHAPSLSLITDAGDVLATRVALAGDTTSRKRGLLGRTEFCAGEALIIAPCSAIHTWFMRFSIDAVFADRQGRVLKVREHLVPWRMSGSLRGFAVIELPAGTVRGRLRAPQLLRLEVTAKED